MNEREIFDLPTPEDIPELVDAEWEIINNYDKNIVHAVVSPKIRSLAIMMNRKRFRVKALKVGHIILRFGLKPKKADEDFLEAAAQVQYIKMHRMDIKVVERRDAATTLTPCAPPEDYLGIFDRQDVTSDDKNMGEDAKAGRRREVVVRSRSNRKTFAAHQKMRWLSAPTKEIKSMFESI